MSVIEQDLAAQVRGAIEAESDPPRAHRDEGRTALNNGLQRVVDARFRDMGIWDPGLEGLDGLEEQTFDVVSPTRIVVIGVLYVLRNHGHRMLPLTAVLGVGEQDTSVIRLADRSSMFEPPATDGDLTRGIDRANWAHEIELDLRPST